MICIFCCIEEFTDPVEEGEVGKKHKVAASCTQGVHPEAFVVGTAGTNGWSSAEEGCSEQEYPKITGYAALIHPPAVLIHPPSK